MFIFFILFNIFLLHDSEKYVIEDKKDISTKTVFPVKHIYQLASPALDSGPVNQRDDTLHFYANNAIYIALLRI
jgi:hypothetical protein